MMLFDCVEFKTIWGEEVSNFVNKVSWNNIEPNWQNDTTIIWYKFTFPNTMPMYFAFTKNKGLKNQYHLRAQHYEKNRKKRQIGYQQNEWEGRGGLKCALFVWFQRGSWSDGHTHKICPEFSETIIEASLNARAGLKGAQT